MTERQIKTPDKSTCPKVVQWFNQALCLVHNSEVFRNPLLHLAPKGYYVGSKPIPRNAQSMNTKKN